MKQKNHSLNSGIKGRKAYNNGIKVIYLSDEDFIPEGFVKGGLSNRTLEQIKDIAKKSSDTQKISWKNKSIEEKQKWSDKCKFAQSKLDEAAKKLKYERYLDTISKKDPLEIKEINRKRSLSSKKTWLNKSIEYKKSFIENVISNGGGWNKATIKNTVNNKYGVNNISQLEEVKNKVRNTLKAYSQDKWGCDHPFQAKENRDKAIQVHLDRYGYSNPLLNPIIKAKAIKTNLLRRGVPYGFNFDKLVENNLNRYGFKWNCQLPQCKRAIGSKCSNTKPNLLFASLLDINGIKYEREFSILDRVYDFKVGNILIEINPFATHNSTWGLFNKSCGLDKYYHFNKSKLANEHGYRCIHVWDWDNKNKVINLLKKRTVIYARDCIIKEVPLNISKIFIDQNHLQGYAKDTIRLGLYFKDDLVSIMTFSKPRYNKNYEYELVRFCANSYVIGGAEKLFKYFILKYSPKSIISYCDYSKFLGNTYNKLGFSLKKVFISKHWYNPKTKQHILDSLLLKLGYDKLFSTNYGKNVSNKELMLKNNFVEIYDAGQALYVWLNNKFTRGENT